MTTIVITSRLLQMNSITEQPSQRVFRVLPLCVLIWKVFLDPPLA